MNTVKAGGVPPSTQDDEAEKPVLRAEGLCKAFDGHIVLDNISLELRRGEVVLLRGKNGSGKTTLLNILTGNLEPDAGSIKIFTRGKTEELRFPREWWHSLNPFDHFTPEKVAQEGLGRTWQEIRLFPSQNLRDNISVATPDQLGENPAWSLLRRSSVQEEEKEIRSTTDTKLEKLGLQGRETSSADKVSLGQAKRVAIIRAVQAGVNILFLDEPLAGLDGPGINEVRGLLEDFARNERITLVIVEHVYNISHLMDFTTKVWTLENGCVTVESTDSTQNGMQNIANYEIGNWVEAIFNSEISVVRHSLTKSSTLSIVSSTCKDLRDIVLEVDDLVVRRGRRLVIGKEVEGKGSEREVRGLSFTLRRGQLAILQAPNGWGKTTLLEAIAGLLPISQGSVKLNGQSVSGMPPWERSKFVAFLQARNQSFPSLKVSEVLHLANVSQVPRDIIPFLDQRISRLSGGERQRISIACATEAEPFLVGLFDEPFSALDSEALQHFRSRLSACLEESGVLIAVPSIPEQSNRIIEKDP